MAFLSLTDHTHRLGIIWSVDSFVPLKHAIETFSLQINPLSR